MITADKTTVELTASKTSIALVANLVNIIVIETGSGEDTTYYVTADGVYVQADGVQVLSTP